MRVKRQVASAAARGPTKQQEIQASCPGLQQTGRCQPPPLPAHLLRLSSTASTEEGKLRLWMTLALWVLNSVSLRGVSVSSSPAPTNASRLVQNSICATLHAGGAEGGTACFLLVVAAATAVVHCVVLHHPNSSAAALHRCSAAESQNS